MPGEPQQLNLFWHVLKWVFEFFVLVIMRWKLDISGVAHVPRGSGALLVFNHHSQLDGPMVGLPVVRRRKRPLRFLGKKEHWDGKLRWLLEQSKSVPVDRSSREARAGAWDAVVDALQSGDLLAMAPEGTISESFELMPFRTGAVRAAQAAGVPIIPVIGWGTHRVAPKGQPVRWTRRIPIVVRFMEPFEVSPDADPVAATQELEDLMRAELDRVIAAYPDPEPGDDWWLPKRLGGSAMYHEQFLVEHEARLKKWEARDARREARKARQDARRVATEAQGKPTGRIRRLFRSRTGRVA
ncbi:MAG: lysophospholipid acyltransferase family protein [Nitriliruptorales bacterium]|nr:lysophospholipid acyltransferase family protein [Nitriliruptorales bacterium]